MRTFAIPFGKFAEIAQLVEHNLAKVGVASSSLVFRSKRSLREIWGFFVIWLCRANIALPRTCGKVLLSPQRARKTLKRSWICCKHFEVKKKSLPLQHDWIKAALSKEIKRYSAPNSEYLLFLRHIAVSLSRGTYSVKPKRVLQISLNGNGAKLIHYENIATAFADASYRSWSL